MKKNSSQSLRKRNSNKGFTLVEIMAGVAIIITVLTLGGVAVSYAMQRSRVMSVAGGISNVANGVSAYIQKSGTLGTIPLTEGTIPAAQFNGTGTTSANVAAAGSLDQILLTEGTMEKTLNITMGRQNSEPTGTNAVTWSTANDRFEAAAAPSIVKSAITRAEARVSAPATAPATAEGANFRLDGVNNLPSNVRVAYIVIPNVPASDAHELSLSIDKEALSEDDNTTADNNGVIVYNTPAADGTTTVYAYVAKY